MVYQLTKDELLFLSAFCGCRLPDGFPQPQTTEGMNWEETAVALQKNQLLLADPQGGYSLPEELTHLLMLMHRADAGFSIRGNDRGLVASFQADAIVLLEYRASRCELMWLPFLPMLIGACANLLEPFLNEKTEAEEPCPDTLFEQYRERIRGAGAALEWQLDFYRDGVRTDQLVELYSDGLRQLMLQKEDGVMRCSVPDKADCVNAITRIVARLHAYAIEKGGLGDVH